MKANQLLSIETILHSVLFLLFLSEQAISFSWNPPTNKAECWKMNKATEGPACLEVAVTGELDQTCYSGCTSIKGNSDGDCYSKCYIDTTPTHDQVMTNGWATAACKEVYSNSENTAVSVTNNTNCCWIDIPVSAETRAYYVTCSQKWATETSSKTSTASK